MLAHPQPCFDSRTSTTLCHVQRYCTHPITVYAKRVGLYPFNFNCFDRHIAHLSPIPIHTRVDASLYHPQHVVPPLLKTPNGAPNCHLGARPQGCPHRGNRILRRIGRMVLSKTGTASSRCVDCSRPLRISNSIPQEILRYLLATTIRGQGRCLRY